MSIEEKIIRKYINNSNFYIIDWIHTILIYFDDVQKSGDDVLQFIYRTSVGGIIREHYWYIPKKYYNNELRKYKLKKLLS